MTRRLAAHVILRDPDSHRPVCLGPDDDIPTWAAAKITNPKAWASEPEPETTVAEGDPLPSATAPQPSVQPATSDAPPRAGRGSSRQAWADFAAAHIEVTDDLSRDDIIAALEQAGTIQKG